MHDEFYRVLNLVQKTGDRFIVMDKNNPQDTFVVMDIDSYEDILENGANVGYNQPEEIDYFHEDEDDLLEQADEKFDEFSEMENFLDESELFEEDARKMDENIDIFRENNDFLPNESANMPGLDNDTDYGTIEQKKSNERWSIPPEVKFNQEGEELAEDKFYLEDIN